MLQKFPCSWQELGTIVFMLKFNLEVKSESRDMGITIELQASAQKMLCKIDDDL